MSMWNMCISLNNEGRHPVKIEPDIEGKHGKFFPGHHFTAEVSSLPLFENIYILFEHLRIWMSTNGDAIVRICVV